MTDGVDRNDILHRILSAVESTRQQNGLDLLLAVLLSVTALASTWCAYQSQLWNGEQIDALADAEIATQLAHERALAATQRKTMDAVILLQFMEARERDDDPWAELVHRRMPSPLREAVDAWLKLDPLNNPDAPPPDKMPQYVLQADGESREAAQHAHTLRSKAHLAGKHGDEYVLLTMLLALVLFFGGIACTIQSLRLRWGLALISLFLFFVTIANMAMMPVNPS